MHFFDPITDFIFIENEPEAADVIFIPGGPCGEIALHAAELYHQGYAPLLIPSGNSGSRLPRRSVTGKIPRPGIPDRSRFFLCDPDGKRRPGRKHPAGASGHFYL